MIARMVGGTLKTAALLAVAAVIAASPVCAQEETTEQTNEGEWTNWVPIISSFYALPQDVHPVWPEAKGDGPPTFPDLAAEQAEGQPAGLKFIDPPFNFVLEPTPPDRAARIDTDWLVLQKPLEEEQPVSGWLVAYKNGKPRLWTHACIDDDNCLETKKLVGYTNGVRLFVRLGVNIVQEAFAIPDKDTGDKVVGDERRELIRDNVLVNGTVEIRELDGVRPSGRGGAAAEDTNPTVFQLKDVKLGDLSGSELTDLGQQSLFEFVPRRETVAKGGLYDGVIEVRYELELEPGWKLGFEAPERKKIRGQIRFVVGPQEIDIDQFESQQIGSP